MLPIASSVSNFLPIQATLVSTPIPESSTYYASAISVAPPVSNAQINNNASGNPSVPAVEDEAAASATAADFASTSSAVSASANLSSSAQSNFLTQLISQEVPPALQQGLQGLLAQYEKLVAYSYVKYKPSDAGIPPQSSPASTFGTILQQEHPAPAPVQPQVTQAAAPQTAPPVETAPQPPPVQQAPVNNAANDVAAANDNIVVLASPPSQPQVAQAYTSTITRNNTSNANTQLELA